MDLVRRIPVEDHPPFALGAGSGSLPVTLLEKVLLAGALAFYAVALPVYFTLIRPGFCRFDEEGLLDQLQFWREGRPLIHGIGWSSLYRWLCAGLVLLDGPHLYLLHLPAFIAVLLEGPLLYAWLKPKAGERAALWAALADLVAAATFARGASILGCAVLPFCFLVGALASERGRGAPASILVGFYMGVMLLDYEGWVGALLFLVPYSLWLRRRQVRSLAALVFGGLLGLGVALAASEDFLRKFAARGAVSGPQLGLGGQLWSNLVNLALPTDRLPFADAAFHTWPSPWILVPALVGLAVSARRRPWLLWLAVCGAAAFAMKGTALEPQRLSLCYLGLCALAGVGVARLWRVKGAPALCVLLLVFGVADEGWAWHSIPAASTAKYYGASDQWERSVRWLKVHEPAGGWRVISGLGDNADAAYRFLLADAGVPAGGAVPVAVVHTDFRPALNSLHGAPWVRIGESKPVFLCFPSPEDAQRLESVSDSLEALRWAQTSSDIAGTRAAAELWLRAAGHSDPWARTAAWNVWLLYSMLGGRVDPGGVQALLTDSLVSAQAPDSMALVFRDAHPGVSRCFSDKAVDIDPSSAGLSLGRRVERY